MSYKINSIGTIAIGTLEQDKSKSNEIYLNIVRTLLPLGL
jgi:hypothetical protein